MGARECYREAILDNIEYNSKKCTDKGGKAVNIMMIFLATFKDYGLVPSIFQEVQITPPANQPITNQRIALLSKDGSEQVSIFSNRIDYEIKAQNDIKLGF